MKNRGRNMKVNLKMIKLMENVLINMKVFLKMGMFYIGVKIYIY